MSNFLNQHNISTTLYNRVTFRSHSSGFNAVETEEIAAIRLFQKFKGS